MMKSLIIVRKYTWLRLKRWIWRINRENELVYPDPRRFMHKADAIEDKRISAERSSNKLDEMYWKGAQSVIDWIKDYGSAEDTKRN